MWGWKGFGSMGGRVGEKAEKREKEGERRRRKEGGEGREKGKGEEGGEMGEETLFPPPHKYRSQCAGLSVSELTQIDYRRKCLPLYV